MFPAPWDPEDDDFDDLFAEEVTLPESREVKGPSGADLTARALAREAGARLWAEVQAELRRKA